VIYFENFCVLTLNPETQCAINRSASKVSAPDYGQLSPNCFGAKYAYDHMKAPNWHALALALTANLSARLIH
jgi:hypothetical protein